MELDFVELTDCGLRFDRSFAVVQAPSQSAKSNDFPFVKHLTIKKTFALALFHPEIDATWTKLTIRYVGASPATSVTVPLTPSPFDEAQARKFRLSIFGTGAIAIDTGNAAAAFFTKHLGLNARLVYIGGDGKREIPGAKFAPNWAELVGASNLKNIHGIKFADASPLLVTSTASERELYRRFPEDDRKEDILLRLRPNIHIDVGEQLPAFDEDKWRTLRVQHVNASQPHATIVCIYPCVRCLSINADSESGEMSLRDRQVYGLLARDRRVNQAFPRKSRLCLCS